MTSVNGNRYQVYNTSFGGACWRVWDCVRSCWVEKEFSGFPEAADWRDTQNKKYLLRTQERSKS